MSTNTITKTLKDGRTAVVTETIIHGPAQAKGYIHRVWHETITGTWHVGVNYKPGVYEAEGGFGSFDEAMAAGEAKIR